MKVVNDQIPRSDPDSDIILLIAKGNQQAFRTLVDRHTNTLLSYATYMLGDPFMAEDIVQTVFLKTWKMVPNWKPGEANLLSWMRKVTTNLCIDRLRKKKAILTDKVPDTADIHPIPVESVVANDTQRLVLNALQDLPDSQRAAISLSYYEHVSQKEGASILGVTESAFESLLVRARRNLRSILNDQRENLSYIGAHHGT